MQSSIFRRANDAVRRVISTTRSQPRRRRWVAAFEGLESRALLTAAPTTLDLLGVSDTGFVGNDNITKLNNASPETALQFSVGSTIAGATVNLFADGVLIATTTATGTTTTLTTDGATLLNDGVRLITATQVVGSDASAASTALSIVIDTLAPNVWATNKSTGDNTPSISGAANDTLASLSVTVDGQTFAGSVISTNWTLPDDAITSPLALGSYDVALSATDYAGNIGTATSTGALTITAASPIVVTTLSDRNNGIFEASDVSLREAIIEAQQRAGDDQITFDSGLSGTITLTLGALDIQSNVTITGSASGITISGNATSRVMSVSTGVDVSLSNLTITGGRATDTLGGAGILSAGNLTLDHVTVTGNTSTNGSGGGIRAQSKSTLAMRQSTVSSNSVTGTGGGIEGTYAALAISDSTIANNTATSSVGGVYASGWLTIDRTTVSGNQATNGGGVYLGMGFETIAGVNRFASISVIRDSIISNNNATTGQGGGLIADGRQITLLRTSISGNTSGTQGGGIFTNTREFLRIIESEIAGNTSGSGGGIRINNSFAGSAVEITQSIIASNAAIGSTGPGGIPLSGSGGGVYNNGVPLTIRDSLFASNTTAGSGSNSSALFLMSSILALISNTSFYQNNLYVLGGMTLRNSTIDGTLQSFSGTPQLYNTIVATASGGFNSASAYNLIGNIGSSTGLTGTGTIYGTSAAPLALQLNTSAVSASPLQIVNGRVPTIMLSAGSPAIDAGLDALALNPDGTALTFDAQGNPRVRDGNLDGVARVDIGAAEYFSAIDAPGTPDLDAGSDSGVSNTDNLTNRNNADAATTLQFLVPNTTPGATVEIGVGGIVIGSAVATGTSTIVVTDGATPISDGLRAVAARQTIDGLTSAWSASLAITIDTTPPVVALTLPNFISTDTTPAVSGTVNESITALQITIAGQTYTATFNGTNWSLADNTINPPLTVGLHEVLGTATDRAGNTGSNTTTNRIAVAPAAPGTPDLWASSDTGHSSTDNITRFNNATPATALTFSMMGTIPGALVELVTSSGLLLGSAIATDTTTTISTNGSTVISDGTYMVFARQTVNGARSADSAGPSVRIDTTNPTVTINPTTTPDTTPLLSGTYSEWLASVQVTVAGKTYTGQLSGGNWNLPDYSITTALDVGVYDIAVVVTDDAGNSGSDTTSDELTILPPTLSIPVLQSAYNTGSTSDALTRLNNASSQSVLGFNIFPTLPGASVELLADGVVIGTATATGSPTTVLTDGSSVLADGTHNFTARQTFNGLTSRVSDPRTWTIDSLAPTVSVESLTTSDATPRISGTASELMGSAQVIVNGKTYNAIIDNYEWYLLDNVISPALGAGVYEVTVNITDRAGNPATDTTSNELTIGMGAPATPVLQSDSDTWFHSDRITSRNNASLEQRLTFFVPGTIPGTLVELLTSNGVIASAIATGTTTTLTTDGTAPLPDGVMNFFARQSFEGQTSPNSAALSVTIDTVAPLLSASKLSTTDTSPAFIGTSNEPLDYVQVTINGKRYDATVNNNAPGGPTWSLPNDTIDPALGVGIYDVSYSAYDIAGNLRTAKLSGALIITLDSPGVPDLMDVSDTGLSSTDNLTSLKNNSSATRLQFVVDNTAPGATVELYADGTLIGSALASGPSTTVTTNGLTTLANGVRAITARQVFNGARSAASPALSVTIDAVAPTVTISPVVPAVRLDAPDSVTITFSEAISNFDLSDLVLRLDGTVVPLGSVALSSTDQITWTLSGLTSVASSYGSYTLTLNAASSGILDSASNSLANDASVSFTTVSAPPTIASLTASPSPILRGSNLTLTASGVAVYPGMAITKVDFYLESNNLPGLQTGTDGDTLLGTDTSSSGGYSWTGSTTTFPVGTDAFYAVAQDSLSQRSSPATATARINLVPTTTAISATPTPVVIGAPITITLTGAADTAPGVVASAEFWRDVNSNGVIDVAIDSFLGNGVNTATGTWSLTTSTAGFPLSSSVKLLGRVSDDDGGNSTTRNVTIATNVPPTIAGLTPSPDPIVKSVAFTLTAVGVADTSPGKPIAVSFYRDANANGVLDIGIDTLLGSDSSSTGGWTFSTTASSSWPSGANTFFARAKDSQYAYSEPVTLVAQVNARPTTTGLTFSPTAPLVGASVTMTTTGAADSDGTVAAVEFWRDLNNNSLIDPGTDEFLATSTAANVGTTSWAATISTTGWPFGTVRIITRALDNQGTYSTLRIATLATNVPPTLAGLTVSTDPIVKGRSFTLTAIDVTDTAPGTPAAVEFYRDTNNNGVLDIGTDTLLGTDKSATGGWSYAVTASTSWAGNSSGFFARAKDNQGAFSEPVSLTATLNAAPVIGTLTATPTTLSVGTPLKLSASKVTDAAPGSVTAVEFYLDTDHNSLLDPLLDTFLGNGINTASGTWSLSGIDTSLFPLGSVRLIARAKDDLGTWSAIKTVLVQVA